MALKTSGVFALGALGGGTGSPTRRWGGMRGRAVEATTGLQKTGVLLLSELLQASYGAGADGIKDRSGAVIKDRAGQAIQARS